MRDLVERLLAVRADARDAWLDRELGFDLPVDGELPRGAVPYLPCGVAEILAMAREVRVDDVFVDIGSGLGRVMMLVHLVTGARCHGIEIQASLVAAAREHCIGLPITFEHANAAEVALDGSRFFLYAPCNGELLARVLERIRDVAKRRAIVVGAVGVPLDVPWLAPRPSSSALMLYDSKPA